MSHIREYGFKFTNMNNILKWLEKFSNFNFNSRLQILACIYFTRDIHLKWLNVDNPSDLQCSRVIQVRK
jgi:hypothetical protein